MLYSHDEGDRIYRVFSKLALIPLLLLLSATAVAQLMVLEVGPFSQPETEIGNSPNWIEDLEVTP